MTYESFWGVVKEYYHALPKASREQVSLKKFYQDETKKQEERYKRRLQLVKETKAYRVRLYAVDDQLEKDRAKAFEMVNGDSAVAPTSGGATGSEAKPEP